MPLFSKLFPHELAYITKNQTIIHLISHRRISELIRFGGSDAATHYKNGLKYMCCAKVNLKRRGNNIFGYAIDEGSDKLIVRRDTGDIIEVRKPEFDRVRETYVYETSYDSGHQSEMFSLSQLWPLQIKISKSGHASFIMSVATLNEAIN